MFKMPEMISSSMGDGRTYLSWRQIRSLTRTIMLQPAVHLFVKPMSALLVHLLPSKKSQDLAIRVSLLVLASTALIWLAVFMYLTFYYMYMPVVEHILPVNIQYDACNHDHNHADSTGSNKHCDYPHAFVRLADAGEAHPMSKGQSYKIFLHMEMPDSAPNWDVGMFMVCASMRDERAELLDHSCRSTLMRYRSSLVRTIRTWLFSPLYVFDWHAEQQRVEVELFEEYGLDQRAPVRDVYVELQTRRIQLYGVELRVVAHFSGLRYAMWQWPLVSAFVGISSNLMFILIALALSYYNWSHMLWIEQTVRQRLRLPGLRRVADAATTTDAEEEEEDQEGILLEDRREIEELSSDC